MLNLLSSNFSRLKKNRSFLFAAIFMVIYAAAVIIYVLNQKALGSEIAFDTLFANAYGLGGMIAFPGIVLSIVCGIFIGTDFSDGTLRNKLVVGKSREKIYLANFITCAVMGIILHLIYVIIICIAGLPWLGGIEMPLRSFMYIVWDGIWMITAYAAIFTMLAMVLKDKTAAVVVGILLTLLSMFASLDLMNRTFEPEFITVGRLVDGAFAEEVVPNRKFLSEGARRIVQVIIDALPSGQSVQLSHLTAPNIEYMSLYSFAIAAAANFIGISVFKKADLK